MKDDLNERILSYFAECKFVRSLIHSKECPRLQSSIHTGRVMFNAGWYRLNNLHGLSTINRLPVQYIRSKIELCEFLT